MKPIHDTHPNYDCQRSHDEIVIKANLVNAEEAAVQPQ
jgi:hypothetical protein